MSPEQARGNVWSLGAILYEILTLCPPHEGRTHPALIVATLSGPPRAPSERAPERRVPAEVEEACVRALAMEPDARFPSAGALGAAVMAYLEGSHRRERAARHLADARAAWARHLETRRLQAEALAEAAALRKAIEPWRSLDEKAARGVDGRPFPWGGGFDASLCHMRNSRPGRPRPEPVGAFRSDLSVYGVRDTAGGVRDWAAETEYAGVSGRRASRGGSWISVESSCRSASRIGLEAWHVGPVKGFRLARPARRG
jgi:hypothetical protein